MRIVACPVCRQLMQAGGRCRTCGPLVPLLEHATEPVVYPFAALKNLPRQVRRQVSQAIHNARRARS